MSADWENCPIKQKVDDVREIQKGVVEDLKTKADAGNMYWAIGLLSGFFLLVGIATVGFLWHGQNAIADRVISNHTENITAIGEVKGRFISIETKLDDWMKQNGNSVKAKGDKK